MNMAANHALSRSSLQRGHQGFTLLEVILSIGLVMAVVGGLFAFYIYAADVRKAVAEQTELISAERNIMDHATDELRAAMVYTFLRVGMEGTSDQVKFVSAAVPGASVWTVPEGMQTPPPPEQDLRMITYRLRIDEDGNAVGLERICQRNMAPESGTPQGLEVGLLSDRLRFVHFRYFDGTSWQASWRDQGTSDSGGMQTSLLPMAVEINLGTDPLEQGESPDDYIAAHKVFRRVVYLPVGSRPLTGAIISGPGGAMQ